MQDLYLYVEPFYLSVEPLSIGFEPLRLYAETLSNSCGTWNLLSVERLCGTVLKPGSFVEPGTFLKTLGNQNLYLEPLWNLKPFKRQTSGNLNLYVELL